MLASTIGSGSIEREREDSAGDITADARECPHRLGFPGNHTPVLSNNRLRGRVKLPGSPVVPQPFPCLQDVVEIGGGQRTHAGIPGDEPLEVGDHRCHRGLNQHHLGNQNPVWVPVGTPR